MPPKQPEPYKGPILWERDEDTKDGTKEGLHPMKYGPTLGSKRGARMTSGFHHIALVCRDMSETIKFYEEALGMRLQAIYPMHGIRGAKHCFLSAGSQGEISFVEFQQNDKSDIAEQKSFFAPWKAGHSFLHHMAYRCESLEQLHRLRDQVKATGTAVSKIVDHDFIHSCYFTDPNGYNLELTCTLRGYGEPEYDPSILNRKISEEENAHASSDTHGKNVIKSKL